MVSGEALNIVLFCLVVVLAVLLVIRQRQLHRLRPMKNLEQALASLTDNLLTSRGTGNIQKVASQLSNILIEYLQARRILFFRCQRRLLEMNYVYGLKNVQRARYRIPLSKALQDRLTTGRLLTHPDDLREMLGQELARFLIDHTFNLVFPIYWKDNLFGVYFICTPLDLDHPLIKMFLMFLNQNLSVTYQLSRLESARKGREAKEVIPSDGGPDAGGAAVVTPAGEDPGPLIEMFSHHKVEDLMAGLCHRIKVGLKADKIVFISRTGPDAGDEHRCALGVDKDIFKLGGDEFRRIFGMLNKRQIYDVNALPKTDGSAALKESFQARTFRFLSTFSLSDDHQGLLFWNGKEGYDAQENRILERMERVARRALVNAREFEKYEEMSYTDGLTGLYNHRYFIRRINEEIQRAERYDRKLGLLLFDIDDFKLYNDRFGHQWGDRLLRNMGQVLISSLRTIDIVARYGGDEFGIIMPEADKMTCQIFMDRLRHAIVGTDFRNKADGFEGRITISVGAAIFPDDAGDTQRLIYCSDMALLHSKNSGRNRSTLFLPELLREKSPT